mgnify:CR=1 FL=1
MGMTFKAASFAAIAAFAGMATPAAAFCDRECYEKVRQPDTYATVERQVVVRPGYSEVVRTPPVVLDRVARVETPASLTST